MVHYKYFFSSLPSTIAENTKQNFKYQVSLYIPCCKKSTDFWPPWKWG